MHPPEWDCLSFSFFFSCVAFCPGGLQVLKRAQYPHIHILNLFWCQSPVPVDNTCSFGRLSLTQCLLFWPVHSHPSPHSQSVSETEKQPETRVLSNTPPHPTGESILYLGSHPCKLPVIFKFDGNSARTYLIEHSRVLYRCLWVLSNSFLFDPRSKNFLQVWC